MHFNLFTREIIDVQCESKKIPLRFSGNFSKTVGNFLIKFYMPIIRSYLRQNTNFCSIICIFDEGMPYKCDHPKNFSVNGGHFEHIMLVALNMA